MKITNPLNFFIACIILGGFLNTCEEVVQKHELQESEAHVVTYEHKPYI